jgi:hypothetical protein
MRKQKQTSTAERRLIRELNVARAFIRSGFDPETVARNILRERKEKVPNTSLAGQILANHAEPEPELSAFNSSRSSIRAHTDSTVPSHSILLSLPAEIRMMIYRFAICEENLEAESCTQEGHRKVSQTPIMLEEGTLQIFSACDTPISSPRQSSSQS